MERCHTRHHCVLATPRILKANDFMSPELTHVAPFKTFTSLLFAAFPNDSLRNESIKGEVFVRSYQTSALCFLVAD